MALGLAYTTLAAIVGTLLAIVYSLRILVLMERRVARVESHIEKLAAKILAEEYMIEKKVVKKAPARKSK